MHQSPLTSLRLLAQSKIPRLILGPTPSSSPTLIHMVFQITRAVAVTSFGLQHDAMPTTSATGLLLLKGLCLLASRMGLSGSLINSGLGLPAVARKPNIRVRGLPMQSKKGLQP